MSYATWLLFLFGILAAIYLFAYFQYPRHVDIIQTSLQRFQFDILREKQPIVIEDRVVSLQDLCSLWFKHNTCQSFVLDGSSQWHKNKYKYLMVQAEQEGDLYLYPRGKPIGKDGAPIPEESLLAIHVLPGQLVLLPFRWYYLLAEPMRVKAVGVHDYITYLL